MTAKPVDLKCPNHRRFHRCALTRVLPTLLTYSITFSILRFFLWDVFFWSSTCFQVFQKNTHPSFSKDHPCEGKSNLIHYHSFLFTSCLNQPPFLQFCKSSKTFQAQLVGGCGVVHIYGRAEWDGWIISERGLGGGT